MRTVLIYFSLIISLTLTGCSRGGFSLIHHVEVQQGNAVTQEMVDKLSLGMTKRQVQLVMGTPMIVDVFQQDRWDYPYILEQNNRPVVEQNVSLFFEDEQLARIAGDFQPSEAPEAKEKGQERVSVTVPYQDRNRRGVLTRLWRFLTFRNRDEPPPE